MFKLALFILIAPSAIVLVRSNYLNKPVAITQAVQPTETIQTVQLPTYEKPTAQRLLELTNIERVKAGVKPLIMDERLNQSAQKKADEMAVEGWDDTPHINKIGISGHTYIFKTMPSCKYGSENLLHDFYDVKDAFNGWMNSPAHKAAIVDAKYEYIGIAMNGVYIAQHFCSID